MKRTRVNEEKSLNSMQNEVQKESKRYTLKKFKKQVQGITLIALVVTIIVLLILAGVAISLTIGQNGIFSRAEKAANTWRNAESNEQLAMGELEDWIDKYGNGESEEIEEDEEDTTKIFAQLYKNETDGSEVLVFTNTDSYRESGLTYETSYDITNEHFSAGDDGGISNLPPWLDISSGYNTTIKTAKIANEIKPKYTSCMFAALSALENIENINNLNTENTLDMAWMFASCEKLQTLDLSGINTSKVEDMSSMFNCCYSLENIDVSNFNTKNVTDMSDMFYNNRDILSINFGDNFNTSNVTSMLEMFSGCENITSLDISSFDTRNVRTMEGMFTGCSNLKNIYVGPNWIADNAYQGAMFTNCGTDHVTPIE